MVRKVTPAGVVTTLAGQAGVFGSADGTGTNALLGHPEYVALDGAGNLYIADSGNDTIRKLTPAGVVTTLAGSAGNSGSADGTNSAARFNDPLGIAVDSAGNLYVADANNNTIRKVTPVGTNWVVTTLAGSPGNSGSTDGTGTNALFNFPFGLAVDSVGNVYVADYGNYTIRKVTPAGAVTTLAGSAGNYGYADGTGTNAVFTVVRAVAVDSAGNAYVADFDASTIRKVTPAGAVTTLAGVRRPPDPWEISNGGLVDGTGGSAQFDGPQGVVVDSAGNLYVSDTYNHTIRKGFPASLGTAADFTAAEPERRPVRFWHHRSSQPGGGYRVFGRFVPVAGPRHLHPRGRDEPLCQPQPAPGHPVLPRPRALSGWGSGGAGWASRSPSGTPRCFGRAQVGSAQGPLA